MENIISNIKSFISNHNKKSSSNLNLKSSSKIKHLQNYQTNDDCVRYEEVVTTAKFLQTIVPIKPKIGIICGSGLGGLANLIKDSISINYSMIPNFPVSTVAGHDGSLVFGYLSGKPVVCMKGRIHAYEGYSLAKCTFPIRVMKQMGVETIIITNAAGGLNRDFNVADIMLINDHVFFPGFSGNNPLRGFNDERFGKRFPSMNDCYDRSLMKLAKDLAEKHGMKQFLRTGVYGMCGGPNFETVAEAKLLQMLGIDAVGMSTVHEAIVAHHSGMRILAFSLITNKIIMDHDTDEKTNHEEVLIAAKKRSNDFEKLIKEIVNNIHLNATNDIQMA